MKIITTAILLLISIIVFGQKDVNRQTGVCIWFDTTKGIGELNCISTPEHFQNKYFFDYKCLPIEGGRFITPEPNDTIIFVPDEYLRIKIIIEIK